MTSDIDGILREQSRYYEDRAPEYDDVWYRRGIYDLGPEANRRWFQETARLEAALDDFAPSGVLELAAGTGLFTRHIAPHATRLIAIDAAASALAINRDRLGDDHIEYVQADLFEWEPPDGVRFDAIVFAFLISHVLPERFDEFWHRLAVARARRSRVLLRRSRGCRTPSVDDRGHRARRPRIRAQAAHGRAGVHDREGVLRAGGTRGTTRRPRMARRRLHHGSRVLPRHRVDRLTPGTAPGYRADMTKAARSFLLATIAFAAMPTATASAAFPGGNETSRSAGRHGSRSTSGWSLPA